MNTTPSKVIPAEQLDEAAKLKIIFDARQDAAKLKGKRLSQIDVGEACGWASAQSIMSQLMSGKMRMGLEALVKLAHVLKFRPEEVSPRLAKTIELIAKLNAKNLVSIDADSETYRLPITTGCVPVKFKADISVGGGYSGGYSVSGKDFGLLRIHSNDKDAYAVMIIGNALSPRIRAHEFVVVEPGHPVQSGDDVLVNFNDGTTMVKEFIFHRDGLYRFDSLKAGIEPLFLNENLVHSVEYIDAIVKKTRFEPS